MTEDMRRVMTFGMVAMIVAVLVKIVFSRENRRMREVCDNEFELPPTPLWATFFGTMIGTILGCCGAGVVMVLLLRYLP